MRSEVWENNGVEKPGGPACHAACGETKGLLVAFGVRDGVWMAPGRVSRLLGCSRSSGNGGGLGLSWASGPGLARGEDRVSRHHHLDSYDMGKYHIPHGCWGGEMKSQMTVNGLITRGNGGEMVHETLAVIFVRAAAGRKLLGVCSGMAEEAKLHHWMRILPVLEYLRIYFLDCLCLRLNHICITTDTVLSRPSPCAVFHSSA